MKRLLKKIADFLGGGYRRISHLYDLYDLYDLDRDLPDA